MKTKFVLHGGFPPKQKQEDDMFFKEILASAPKNANILLVYFAKEQDRVEINKQEDIAQFEKNKGDKTLSFEAAQLELFQEQITHADIIYFHGGSSLKLLESLKQINDLEKFFIGKIVVGDSAGVNVLSRKFYSHVAKEIFEGLGMLPFETICHYSNEYKNVLEESNDEEKLILKEYETRVFYKEYV